MPRKGENIYKRKDGRWEGRYIKEYNLSGKANYSSVYGHSYREAKAKLKDAQVMSCTLNETTSKSSTPYKSILDYWLASSQINVKESTYARYSHLVDCHIKPVLGKYPVSMISTMMIEQYTNMLLCSGRIDGKGGLSPKSVSDILTIIKSSMEYARQNQYAVQCHLERLTIKKNITETRVLSIDEQKRLLSLLTAEPDLTKYGILLSLYTGIRIGEVCALRWEHLHLDRGVLEVRETLQRVKNTSNTGDTRTKILISEPKSLCSIRDIPLPNFLREMGRQFETVPQAYVLTGSVNNYIEPRTLQNRFKKRIKECQIKDVNYHSLRHTFATRCIELGFETKSLSEILGHANVNITLNRYVHSSFELKRENMDKLNPEF